MKIKFYVFTVIDLKVAIKSLVYTVYKYHWYPIVHQYYTYKNTIFIIIQYKLIKFEYILWLQWLFEGS